MNIKQWFKSNTEQQYQTNDNMNRFTIWLDLLQSVQSNHLTHQQLHNMYERALFLSKILTNDEMLDIIEDSKKDKTIIKSLIDLYTLNDIYDSDVIAFSNIRFIIKKNDRKKLTDEHMAALSRIAKTATYLINPVYIDMENNCMILD